MRALPYGFRVVGHRAGGRRRVQHAAAFLAHCRCDPRAEPDRESYLSYFAFGDDFLAHLTTEGSERGYGGPCVAPWIWWDIDRPDDLGRALFDARRLVGTILERYREFDEDDVLVFLSGGKGVHVGIPTAWQPEASTEFNAVAKCFASDLADAAGVGVDGLIYSKTRLFRAPNSRHPRTGLHKRRLSLDELTFMKPEAVMSLAREPEPFDPPAGPEQCQRAAEDWTRARQASERDSERRRTFQADGGLRLSGFARRFIRDGELERDRRAVSTFRVAAELSEFYQAHGFAALTHALLTEAALESGLSPSETRREIECGLAHARRQREGGAS